MMTIEKCRAILDRYEQAIPAFQRQYRRTHETELSHAVTMIAKMRAMLDELDSVDPKFDINVPMAMARISMREKFMRWLGFLQGVMYAEGVYTIDQMRAHNMPDDEAFRER